jgi:hypothetical protein
VKCPNCGSSTVEEKYSSFASGSNSKACAPSGG